MNNDNQQIPVVLVIAGHDPSGGAGIQADIESIASAGCHAATIITALTSQNTRQVVDVLPQDPVPFRNQIRLIIEDMAIAACKIGMLGSIELLEVVVHELSEMNIPLVLDPVLGSTSGTAFADSNICQKMRTSLLPITTLVTPNSVEARLLTGTNNLSTAAQQLLACGTEAVLMTGTHEKTAKVSNILYTKHANPVAYHWQRLTGLFHGSGCTLSARIAALLARGNVLAVAVEKAQEYTWQSLNQGLQLGRGPAQPNRFHEYT